MGVYDDFVLPALIDLSLSGKAVSELRKRLLQGVSGRVLEIGFGTGLNLPHYPKTLKKLEVLDTRIADFLARKWIVASHLTVERHVLSAERIPFSDRQFDAVVSTFTLCSIPNVERALKEVHRVLAPGGRIYFLEHGIHSSPRVQNWQRQLNPMNRLLFGGCHLDRNPVALVESAGFAVNHVESVTLPRTPPTHGYVTLGIGVRS